MKTVPVDERIDYFNRKQDYSVVIQGVADASFRFLDISAGYPGSIHDACVLRLSNLHREIEQANWLNRPTKQISGSKIPPPPPTTQQQHSSAIVPKEGKLDLCLLETQHIPYLFG